MIGHRSLFNAVRDAMFLADAETGIVVDANPAAEALCGRNLAELRSLHHTQLHPPEAAERARDTFEQHTQLPGLTEGHVLHKDGHRIPVEICASHFTTSDGRRVLVGVFRDTTERNEAREALRRSEERFRQVAESAGEFIWEVDADGLYVYANPVVESILGYTPQEVVGRTHFYDFFVPETREAVKAAAFDVFARREQFRAFLNWNVRKDGRIVALETSGVPILDANGRLLGYRGADTDVTERKRAEEALRMSEERFQLSVEATSDGLWDWNIQTDETYFSPAYYHMLGYEVGAFPPKGSAWKDLIHPDDRERALRPNIDCIEGRCEQFEVEYRLRARNGEWRWILARGKCIVRDAQGRALRLVGTHVDITERMRAHEELRRNQALLRAVLDGTPVPIYLKDREGRVLMANLASLQALGKPAEEVLGKTSRDYIGDHEAERAIMEEDLRIMETGVAESIERSLTGPRGSRVFLTTKSPLRDLEGRIIGLIGVSRDITDSKRAEEELRENEQHLNSIYNTVSDIIFQLAVEPEGQFRFVSVNAAFLRATGLSLEGVVGKTVNEVIPKPSLTMVLGKYRQAVEENGVVLWEETSDYPTGRLTGEVSVAPVLNNRGTCTHLVGSVHDITKRKLAEEKLVTIMKAVEATSDAVGISDAQGRHYYQNSALSNLFGYATAEELEAAGGGPAVIKDPQVAREMFKAITSGNSWAGELEMVTKSGRVFPAYERADAIRDNQGRIIGLIGIITDITALKRVEKNLRDKEHLLSLSQRIAHIGSWSFDQTAQSLVWTDETYAIYGVSPDTFTPSVESLMGLIHSDDRRAMQEWIGATAAGHSAGRLEFRAVRPDGSIRILSGQGEMVFSIDTHTALMVGTVQDITERKRAEGALREINLLNQLELAVQEALATQTSLPTALQECCAVVVRALDGAFARIWTLNQGGAVLDLQASAGLYTHIDGFHRQVRVGQYKIGLIAAKKQPLLTNNVIGDPSVHDQDWAKKEGMVAFAGYPLLVEGRLLGVMAMFSRHPLPDVALRGLALVASRIAVSIERARTDALLHESEERFRATFEQAAVGIAHVSPEGRFLRVNQRFCAIAGYSCSELLERTFQDITHPDDLALDLEQAKQLLSGERGTYSMEKRYIRKSGEVVWINLTGALVRDNTGQPRWFIAVIEDISSRKQAEEKVRQLSHAMEQSPVLVVMTDVHGAITYVNHKFCEVTGYSFEESISRNPRFLQSGEHSPAMYQALWARITSGETWRGEFHNRKKNGQLYWELAAISPLLDATGQITHFVAVKEDVTERKRADKERENLQAQLAQAQKMESIGRLAGGIAHDFSNLMSVILLHDDLALQELRSGDPLIEPLTEIRNGAERAVAMTQQLMAFSRKRVLQAEVLNLNSVIEECETLVRPIIGEDIHLVFIPGSGLGLVKADRGQLGQIIMNLVLNSRDAMPHGGTLIIETADVELDEADARANPEAKPGSYVRLAVRDTGVGMDQETQAQIFEPFFTTKEVGKGTGLGLSMVYGIVKQSGGYVTVHSKEGHGTEFKMYLPRVLETPEPVVATEVAPGQRGIETILVVEDEPALRKPVCRLLKGAGYQVLAGKDVDEAIQIAMQHNGPLDLLLTDVVMPNLSGPQLAESLRPFYPQMKVLYMSGYPEPRQPDSALPSKVDFIQKPFTKQKLLGRLREVLEGRKLSM